MHRHLIIVIVLVLYTVFGAPHADADSAPPAERQFKLGGYDRALLDADRLDIEISFQLVVNEILESLNAYTVFSVFATFEETQRRFASGEVDGTFCAITDCPQLLDFDTGLPMYAFLYDGQPRQEYVLVTTATESSKTLTDLRRKTLSVPIGHELGEHIADRLVLSEFGESASSFFAQTVYPDSSQTALIDLVFGKVDAVVVTQHELDVAIELNPQIESSTRTLYISPPVVVNLMVISPKATADAIELFDYVVDNFSEYQQSRFILELYGADGVTRVTPQDVTPTLQFVQ
ncbi:MAG: PhnD/SsuA/transferrin family substrate-binding protein [Pseudomonadota bacterium]